MTSKEAGMVLASEVGCAELDKANNDYCGENIEKFIEAGRLAIQALKEKQERDNPQPLSLEQLKEREGKPVYIVSGDKRGWSILYLRGATADQYTFFSLTGTAEGMTATPVFISNYNETWVAYDYEPNRK